MRRAVRALDALLAMAALAGAASLVMEYGFPAPPIAVRYLHIAELVVMAVFVLDRVARLAISSSGIAYVRENIVDFALIAAALGAVVVNFRAVLSAGALYILITQLYLLGVLILRGVGLNLRFAGSGIHPGWLLVGSFLLMIAVGSGLLMLPVAVHAEYASRWYFIDAIFTATSATCVTGLVVVNTGAHFTAFGQAVILALIQAGGLGIMMFGTVLGLLVGKAFTIRQSETLGKMVAAEGVGKVTRVAVFVIVSTFALEIVGALLLYPMFAGQPDTRGLPLTGATAVWESVFHSVSAFCNAGFSLYGDNLMQGVRQGWADPLRGSWQVLGVFAPLIVLGGVGFPVLSNCAGRAWSACRRAVSRFRMRGAALPGIPRPQRLTLNTKLVLVTTAVLIVTGAGIILLVGPVSGQQDWSSMSGGQRFAAAVFQSVAARTAGFNTISMAQLSNAGKLWMCILMIVGGSPASTAGGMKTVTVAVLVLLAVSHLRRRKEVEAFRRSIPQIVISQAVSLSLMYLALVATVTMLLCVVQGPGFRFVDLMFESCSACGTVGLSTGVTAGLSHAGKWVIILGMFVGRIGPLTLLAAAASRLRSADYAYPAEQALIG
jgi:trk system potassium uptake protein TrkH